jgi:DNA-binding YbaB/EbfC family protein
VIPNIGGIGNLMELLKQANKFRSAAEELKNTVAEGAAGGGMVRVRVNGRIEMLDCKIEPQVLADNDAEMLEELIVAATNQALKKIMQAWIDKTIGGANLPGLSEMFGPSGPSAAGS